MFTATTRSARMVSANVISRITASAVGALRTMRMKRGASLMFHATTNRIAASDASGTLPAQGDTTSRTSTSTSACTTPAIGALPPLRMLVAVRAIAPVAAMPPNSGETMLAIPCPTSSWLASCFVPAMPSATTADSSDSIAPSIAIVKAEGSSSITSSKPIDGTENAGSERGMAPKVDSIVAMPGSSKASVTAVAATIASSGPGTFARPGIRGPYSASTRLPSPSSVVGQCSCANDPSRRQVSR